MHSRNNISNYFAHVHIITSFSCQSETWENTAMLISMVFLYVAGVNLSSICEQNCLKMLFFVCGALKWLRLSAGIIGHHATCFLKQLFVKCCLVVCQMPLSFWNTVKTEGNEWISWAACLFWLFSPLWRRTRSSVTNVFTQNISELAALKLVMWQKQLLKYCCRHRGTYGNHK